MDTIEKQSLDDRTRQRNALTWLPLDYGGIMVPLASMENDLDFMARAGIENFMAISDEAWGIKEEQRDRTIELSQAEIDQDITLAEAKAATGRAKIAIEKATDEYVLAAKIYDARVKGLIMAAKEYAALVEREQLAVEESRIGLAIDKEALRGLKIQADIAMEAFNQAMVEADIARTAVEVAKAHVRVAMAGIEVGRIAVQVLETQIEIAMTEVEKATIQADVAMILAEALTHKLSATKLGVGKAEITAEYSYIQGKLDDALALMDTRKLIENILIEAEKAMKEEVDLLRALEEATLDLAKLEVEYAQAVLAYETTKTEANLQQEIAIRKALIAARNTLNDARMQLTISREAAQTTAAGVVAAAQKVAHAFTSRSAITYESAIEYISG